MPRDLAALAGVDTADAALAGLWFGAKRGGLNVERERRCAADFEHADDHSHTDPVCFAVKRTHLLPQSHHGHGCAFGPRGRALAAV
jgi:hypothetical protein